MKCPACAATDLVMSERQGIEIDYCPKCRGIWLDRGELDKIIERTQREFTAAAGPALGAPMAPQAGPPRYRSPDDSDIYPAMGGAGSHPQQGQQPYYYKKRKHWLLELLD